MIGQAVSLPVFTPGPARCFICPFHESIERLPGCFLFHRPEKGSPAETGEADDLPDWHAPVFRTAILALAIPDGLPPANIQPGVARPNLRNQPAEITRQSNDPFGIDYLVIAESVNYLDIGCLWFIAFLAIITTITLIIFESDGRGIDNERNGNAPVHDTHQQTGDRARQAAFKPLARVIISDAYGEKAILVGYQARITHPGIKGCFGHFHLQLA